MHNWRSYLGYVLPSIQRSIWVGGRYMKHIEFAIEIHEKDVALKHIKREPIFEKKGNVSVSVNMIGLFRSHINYRFFYNKNLSEI